MMKVQMVATEKEQLKDNLGVAPSSGWGEVVK